VFNPCLKYPTAPCPAPPGMGWGGGIFDARIKQMTAFIYLSNLCADYPGPGALQCHLSQISKKVRPGCNDMAHILSRTLSCDPFVALWDGLASLSLSFGVPLASLGIPWGAYRIAIHFLCKCTKIIDNTVGLIQLEFAPPQPTPGVRKTRLH